MQGAPSPGEKALKRWAIPWRRTLIVRMLATFLAIMVPVYVLGFAMYSWGLKTAREEIEKSAASQAAFYLQGLEKEIERIRLLQFDCLNDDNLDKLTYRNEVLGPYELLERIQLLRARLYSIQNSSGYIRNVRVHISPISRTLSSVEGLDDLDEAAFLEHRVPSNRSGAQLFHADGSFLMSTIRADGGLSDVSRVMVEIVLEPGAFKTALDQFMTYPGSGAFLLDSQSGVMVAKSIGVDGNGLHAWSSGAIWEETPERVRYVHLDGQEYVVVQAESGYLGMRLVRCIPGRYVLEPLQTFQLWIWVFAAVALGVVVFFSIYTYRAMHKPILALVDSFRKVETGDLEVNIPHDPHNEFGYLYKRFNAMVHNLRMLIDQVYKQRMLVQRAELRQLQSQINPHFLYNSFFILNTMARMGDTSTLIGFTRQLGEYFRFVARNAADIIALGLEVQHAQLYAEIQAMRFARRIKVKFDALPESVCTWNVPRLVIQPLIENAFQYGLEGMEQNGMLHVGFECEDLDSDCLRIVVEDNGDGLTEDHLVRMCEQVVAEDETFEVTGLMNIHRRIRLFFGEPYGLRLERSPLGGLRVTIVIARKEGDSHVQAADRG